MLVSIFCDVVFGSHWKLHFLVFSCESLIDLVFGECLDLNASVLLLFSFCCCVSLHPFVFTVLTSGCPWVSARQPRVCASGELQACLLVWTFQVHSKPTDTEDTLTCVRSVTCGSAVRAMEKHHGLSWHVPSWDGTRHTVRGADGSHSRV